MRDILDPADRWLGSAPFALDSGNKFPVATDDILSILKDSGAVSVDVLANDFDPEGAPLSLVSASAALGTAVAEANDTVTYTPPAGLSGSDTVVYTIVDDVGQTRTGQINITIVEPQLSIDQQADNILAVNAETGLIDVTITEPAGFAGTYQVNTADLLGGPVNLAPPTVSGTVSPNEVLTATAGLWIYDTAAGTPTQSWQWRRNGAEITGALQNTYVVTSADIGPSLSVAQTLTDTFGQRSAPSASVGTAFVPSDDPTLIGWWDASDATTVSQNAGSVSAWADKAGGDDLTQIDTTRRPITSSRMLNGLNVIDFVSGDFMERLESVPASGNIAFHMALVIDGATNAFEAALAVNAANDFQIDSNNATQFDGRLNLTGVGTSTPLSGGPFLGGLILSVIFDRTGAAQADVFISNTLRGSAAYTTPLDTSTELYVMSNRSKNAFTPGAVGELVITGDVSNRSAIHGYLATKWGLS